VSELDDRLEQAVERASENRSGRRVLVVQIVAIVALAAAIIGGTSIGLTYSRTTEECTVEAIATIHVRRAPDYLQLRTTECGYIRADGVGPIDVVDPACDMNTVKVASRYRMTTVGLNFLTWQRRLEEPVILVEAPEGEGCTGDPPWFDGDGFEQFGVK